MEERAPPPAIPSRETNVYKRRSLIAQRMSHLSKGGRPGKPRARALPADSPSPETNSADPSIGMDSLSIQTEDGSNASAFVDAGGRDSLDSPPPPQLPKRVSLANFHEVNHGVEHAVEKHVSIAAAFSALEYTAAVQINNGILVPSTPKVSSRDNANVALKDESLVARTGQESAAAAKLGIPGQSQSARSSMSEIPSAPASAGCAPTTLLFSGSHKAAPQKPTVEAHRAKISKPANIKCVQHVKFNPDLVRFEGLDAGDFSVNKQFGVPFSSVPKIHVPGYEKRIPAILVMLWKRVLENNGNKAVGIFRLAADKTVLEGLKRKINTGLYSGDPIEENVAATLIKIWFRELPVNILNNIDKSLIDSVAGTDITADGNNDVEAQRKLAIKVLSSVQSGFKAGEHESEYVSLLWLLDIMSNVAAQKDLNKMSAKNLAIVVAPNLYSIEDVANPMAAMTWTSRIAKFTEVLLTCRILQSSD